VNRYSIWATGFTIYDPYFKPARSITGVRWRSNGPNNNPTASARGSIAATRLESNGACSFFFPRRAPRRAAVPARRQCRRSYTRSHPVCPLSYRRLDRIEGKMVIMVRASIPVLMRRRPPPMVTGGSAAVPPGSATNSRRVPPFPTPKGHANTRWVSVKLPVQILASNRRRRRGPMVAAALRALSSVTLRSVEVVAYPPAPRDD
jgi:hypothetical protein